MNGYLLPAGEREIQNTYWSFLSQQFSARDKIVAYLKKEKKKYNYTRRIKAYQFLRCKLERQNGIFLFGQHRKMV